MILGCLLGASSFVKAVTFIVQAGDDLQAALNAANCGDEVVLQAGATFIVPGLEAPFLLKDKGPCTGTDADYITIRTSVLSGLPPAGTRIRLR